MIGAPIHSFQNADVPIAVAGNLNLEGFTPQSNTTQSAASAALSILGRASHVGSDSSTTLEALHNVGISARYIKLLQPSAGYMNFTEVLAYSTRGGPNIALGATVSASSHTSDYPLSSLTDGNSNNWTSTNRDSDAGWFLIDLGSVKSVTKIVVINRIDCCQARANGVIVSLMNNSQTTVFTAHPFSDRSGNTLYADLRSRDSLAYSTYTVIPPQQQVDAS